MLVLAITCWNPSNANSLIEKNDFGAPGRIRTADHLVRSGAFQVSYYSTKSIIYRYRIVPHNAEISADKSLKLWVVDLSNGTANRVMIGPLTGHEQSPDRPV